MENGYRTDIQKNQKSARTNISHLPAKITQEIEGVLDYNPETSSWREFLKIASTLRDEYEFSQADIESKFGRYVFGGGSPTSKLISELGARGMHVGELVYILDQLKLENLLLDLKPYEEIRIVLQPAETKHVRVGDQLDLEVEATGFPYPKYQWFKLNGGEYDEIPGAKEATFKVSRACLNETGTYCCRLYNGGEAEDCKFTHHSTVTVYSRPSSPTEKSFPLAENEDCRGPMKPVLPQVLTEPEDVCANLGNRIELICEAVGQKPLTYEWQKDSNVISTCRDIGKLAISNASLRDKGIYTCVIRNQFGKTHSREVTIHVDPWPHPGLQGFPPVLKGIDIILNPKTCSIELGGSCMFSVQARCRLPLTYQWYKDGQKLSGFVQPDLQFRNLQELDCQGSYQCMVQCPSTADTMLSHPASLSIKQPTDLSCIEFRPTDKVALLIGNYDYMNETQLKAPKNDVAKMAEAFRSLEFKVVSLLNLTKQEMIAALHEFCNLLGKGVYGVFYFCGHGFEENGQCYFVPPDARSGYTVEDCISHKEVHRCMQKSNPALVVLILDICRIKNKIPSSPPPKKRSSFSGRESSLPMPRGNTVEIFATSEGMYAYEDPENGILVKYLQQFIYQNKPINDFFKDVLDAWKQDPQHQKLQIPEYRATLQQWRRSLSDRILTTGHTQSYNTRTRMWQKAHETPSKREIRISELGNLMVELNFQMEFSNVLHMFAAIKHPGNTSKSIAFPFGWRKSISVMGDIKNVSDTSFTQPGCRPTCTVTKTTFQDLQKLKEDMELNLVVRYCMKDGEDKHHIIKNINLGLPLIANLHLYKERVTEPIEHMEEL